MRIEVGAKHSDGVRSVALVLRNQPVGDVTAVREGDLPVPSTGGWSDIPTDGLISLPPLLAVRRPDGDLTVACGLDDQVRSKRFVVIPHFDDPATCDLELIADAAQPGARFEVPVWELRRTADVPPPGLVGWVDQRANCGQSGATRPSRPILTARDRWD